MCQCVGLVDWVTAPLKRGQSTMKKLQYLWSIALIAISLLAHPLAVGNCDADTWADFSVIVTLSPGRISQ